jgi:antibiotic biosynthesis monooxygenase (ABM) superfamily enzyme
MIKVIEGYELKKSANIQLVFLKLKLSAMTFPGFVSAEHIRSVKGSSIAALLYNWERLENWEAWESSKLKQQILQEIDTLSVSESRIAIYEVMPTSAWAYTKYQTLCNL